MLRLGPRLRGEARHKMDGVASEDYLLFAEGCTLWDARADRGSVVVRERFVVGPYDRTEGRPHRAKLPSAGAHRSGGVGCGQNQSVGSGLGCTKSGRGLQMGPPYLEL